MQVSLHNISKSFGSLKVLSDVSLVMESGRIYGLMSPSGAGKTTLLRILMGLEVPDDGYVEKPEHMRLSAVFQEDRLCQAFTPIENVRMVVGKSLTEHQVQAELCRLLPEESLKRPVSTLSGGMKRRTAICRALLAPSDLLLMDEPFTGLDEDTRHNVILYMMEKCAGKITLVTTHQEQDIAALKARLIHLPVTIQVSDLTEIPKV